MSESEYLHWKLYTPLPKDLAGFQKVTTGLIKQGDLIVKYGAILSWACGSVGSAVESYSVEDGAYSIYRRMPVDSHGSIYQKSVEDKKAEPTYRPLEPDEIIEEGDEYQYPSSPMNPSGWFMFESEIGKELRNSACRDLDARTTRPKPQATKPLDPKGEAGKLKPQLQLIPPVLSQETAKALSRGAGKYGPWNWRENKVEIMTYIGAMKRHLDCILEGEDIDPESGAHHLGHVAASCGIVLDAQKHGTLVDNRPKKSGLANVR
jgi:hypothetical protein